MSILAQAIAGFPQVPGAPPISPAIGAQQNAAGLPYQLALGPGGALTPPGVMPMAAPPQQQAVQQQAQVQNVYGIGG